MSAETRWTWWTSPRELLRVILMLRDTRHSIALGTAIGIFLGLTPTVGIQMLLVVAVSLLFGRFIRFNRLAALIAVYVSNPLTLVPIYWFNYRVGTLFVAGELSKEDFSRIIGYHGFGALWDTLVKLCFEIGAPLIVGSLIVATVGGVLTYPLMRWLLNTVRPPKRRPRTLAHRQPAVLDR